MNDNTIEIVARWIKEGGPGVNLESTRKLMAGTVRALATHAGAAAAEPVAWWRISYIDREGNSDADVQIGKDKPTESIMADNGFPWEPLYGSPLAALTSAPAVPEAPVTK